MGASGVSSLQNNGILSSDLVKRGEFAQLARHEAIIMRHHAATARLQLRLAHLAGLDAQAPPQFIFKQIIDAAITLSGSDCGNIQLLDPRAGGLRIRAHRGFSQRFLNYFEVVAANGCACGAAMKQHNAVSVPDVTASEIFCHGRTVEVLLDAGVRSVMSAPLLAPSGCILGVLSAHYRKPRLYDHHHILRFKTLGDGVAALLARTGAADASWENPSDC